MDMMTILELEVQNIKMARDSEEQKQNMNRLLLKEPKWTESAINPQCMINDIGPPPACDSTSSWHDETLKKSQEQNAQLRGEMKEQEKTILSLTKKHKAAEGQFEQNITKIFYKLEEQKKKMADLVFQKAMLVRDLEEQTRISSALEKRDTKIKEVFGNIASTMFLELEYQEELISEMAPDDGECFQPSHNTLKHLVEIIEQ